MSTPQPQIRAIQSQSLLRAVRSLRAGERNEILGRFGPANVEIVEAAFPVSWNSMALHMHLSDIVREIIGPERNIEIWRTTMAWSLERPLFKGFVRMTADLFGVSPASFLRQGERIYDHLTRGLGRVKSWGEGRNGYIELRQFPADLFQFMCYVEGLAGCIQATVELAGVPYSLKIRDADERRGNVDYWLAW